LGLFVVGNGEGPLERAETAIALTVAASVFRDVSIQVIFDEEHSVWEERWAALDAAFHGSVLVVIHTWPELAYARSHYV
jgi:hypothetical protein